MNTPPVNRPIVEIDGDEMAHLSLPNRERTGDKVTLEAAEAVAKHQVGVKCSTITSDASRAAEYGLSTLWPSPNGTIRNVLKVVLFREPIIIDSVPRLVPGWTKPLVFSQ